MSREHELQKLFDLVVDHERDPNPLTEEVMREQKRQCLIMWGDDARSIILRAKTFAKKNPVAH